MQSFRPRHFNYRYTTEIGNCPWISIPVEESLSKSGQLIDLREIKKSDESILIPGGSLLPGSYIYNISGEGQKSESKRNTIL